MGAIVAELLTIHQDSYIVRALAQSSGVTLASGMASAPTIETAEDRAKIRALEALGLRVPSNVTEPAPVPSLNLSSLGNPPLNATNDYSQQEAGSTVPSESIPPESSPPPQPDLATLSLAGLSLDPGLDYAAVAPPIAASSPEPEPLLSFSSTDYSPYSSEPVTAPAAEPALIAPETADFELPLTSAAEPLPSPTPTKTSKASKRKEPPPEPPVVTPSAPEPVKEPNDRSNEIAKISVEMKRLGWTTEQGRRYLKDTYGKRSRQELDDSELLDFLSYLEAQPSSAQSLF